MKQSDEQPDHLTLPDVYRRAFSLVLTLMQGGEFGDPQLLRQRVDRMFESVDRDARELGVSSEDITDARFALTAFLDETIARSDWQAKSHWASHSLALEYFQTNNAGDEFFTRLDALRQRPDARTDVLEVYYTCLALGFEGRYALADPRQLRSLTETIGRDLERIRGRVIDLSPHWEPPEPLLERVRSEIPMWVVTAACLTVLVLLFAVLRYLSTSDAEALAEGLRNALR